MKTPHTTIVFLNVGQGDAAIIILPDEKTALMVDCATSANATQITDYLSQKRIYSLEHIFVTHTDLDHIGGVVELMQNFHSVKTIHLNIEVLGINQDKTRLKRLLQQLLGILRGRGAEQNRPRAGQKFDFQKVAVEVLHPTDMQLSDCYVNGDKNNASVVLQVSYEGKRVLLTGDIAGKGWKWLKERNVDLRADILKFPHHGAWYTPQSDQPSLEEIIREINPSFAVISVGTSNNYGHPHPNVFALLLAQQNLRFVCTQATSQCHPLLHSSRPMPCAENVEVTISRNGLTVRPDISKHAETIKHFSQPQCKR